MSSLSSLRCVFSETFSYRTRAPDFLSSWWNRTSCSRTAVYAFTGTFTNPKLIDPDHIARAMAAPYPVLARSSHLERRSVMWEPSRAGRDATGVGVHGS